MLPSFPSHPWRPGTCQGRRSEGVIPWISPCRQVAGWSYMIPWKGTTKRLNNNPLAFLIRAYTIEKEVEKPGLSKPP